MANAIPFQFYASKRSSAFRRVISNNKLQLLASTFQKALVLILFLSGFIALPVAAQDWSFIKGYSKSPQFAAYGVQGVAAESNTPGAIRHAVGWESNGKLYLFGGYGYAASGSNGTLNDLWEYDPATNNWRWLKGSNAVNQDGTYGTQGTAASANTPGTRQNAVSWVSNGKLYLFGGYGYGGYFNDLWEYDPATNNWRWLKGSNTGNQYGIYGTQGTAAATNSPGARTNAVGWESNGKLYLFGGYGYAASGSNGSLNDLWEYDPSTNNWRQLKGSNTLNQYGTYGTQGNAAAANTPGARTNAVGWESNGKLYLFGGNGFGASSSGNLNDLWEYDPATNNWRWLKGSNTGNQYGTYGTQGNAAAANTPGARTNAVSWESNGKLYLFGGNGYAAGSSGNLNDLWEYDPATNNWRWLKGNNAVNQYGTYGTQGTAAAANTPGARTDAVSWESNGKLYLFGGDGYAAGSSGNLNDLWEYDPATNNWRWLKGSNAENQNGTYGTQGTAAATNTPGAREGAVGWESNGKLYLFGGYGYSFGNSGSLNDLWEYDPATNNWRWLKGSNNLNQYGIYGSQGTAASANTPGTRLNAVSWESNGKLYLFGGYGYAASGSYSSGALNDL